MSTIVPREVLKVPMCPPWRFFLQKSLLKPLYNHVSHANVALALKAHVTWPTISHTASPVSMMMGAIIIFSLSFYTYT